MCVIHSFVERNIFCICKNDNSESIFSWMIVINKYRKEKKNNCEYYIITVIPAIIRFHLFTVSVYGLLK